MASMTIAPSASAPTARTSNPSSTTLPHSISSPTMPIPIAINQNTANSVMLSTSQSSSDGYLEGYDNASMASPSGHRPSLRRQPSDGATYDARAAGSRPLSMVGEDDVAKLKQKKANYQKAKAARLRAANTFGGDAENVQSGWLKMRGFVKNWSKYYCVLRPGVLLYYKDEKRTEWSGSVLLNGAEVIERPTKKTGFCFKIYHPLEHTIYSTRGPKGEIAIVVPIHNDHCILRAPTEAEGQQWLSNIEEASLKPLGHHDDPRDDESDDDEFGDAQNLEQQSPPASASLTVPLSPILTAAAGNPTSDFEDEEEEEEADAVKETPYAQEPSREINVGPVTEEWGEESKSLMWSILKQLRPSVDLSKIPLPTFILEPRSFLDKLSDYYFHSDVLSVAANHADPVERMSIITKWFLSGFYAQPKGCKKPYNPIIGETFRCYWKHPTDSRTYYIAEQVSHHPPVSAWYAANRQEGYCVNGSLLTRSKFNGASAVSLLEGAATLHLLNFGEEYVITFPLVQVKGLIFPPLQMEMGGTPSIICAQTGLKAELEFKLKPMFGGDINGLKGKIKDATDRVLRTVNGRWDQTIEITNCQTNEVSALWTVSPDTVQRRLPRFKVAKDAQGEFESERLWQKVTAAIEAGDQYLATEEKTVLENNQRLVHKELKANNADWVPKLFRKNHDGTWVYKFMDKKKWNPTVDAREIESEGVVHTLSAAALAQRPATQGTRDRRGSTRQPLSAVSVASAAASGVVSSSTSSASTPAPAHTLTLPAASKDGHAALTYAAVVAHKPAASAQAAGHVSLPPFPAAHDYSDNQRQLAEAQHRAVEHLLSWRKTADDQLAAINIQLEATQQQLRTAQQLLARGGPANHGAAAAAAAAAAAPNSRSGLLLNSVILLLLVLIQLYVQLYKIPASTASASGSRGDL
ncbi:oxysterol binding protein [Capsaspora owczarzaki ATCC 30864]|uniref:Oxysterol binding protein n=1 Tax=Capsaspora owczarzaki (strain ATCC 30864) TaxID=595528 RepID=A0A0D2X3Z7_CAPO3|nr:oxysterol binding protein [Capsaspora owczarzaki ATCC 30864]KJE95179.1 oxysterol binding protein [Capsaspora owczarzaki ATCC 30864]|eukprot:XP_004346330.1 oxysterol binding protein [Capsaspora owczarzaki ATCC 30864]